MATIAKKKSGNCIASGCANCATRKSRCDKHYRRWRFQDPEIRAARLARNRAYRQEHLVEVRAHERVKHLADPTRRQKNNRASYRRHPQNARTNFLKYRSRLNGSIEHHTLEQWLAKLASYDARCAYCGSIGKMTRDHVVPLSLGGSNAIENIVPACQWCNGSKWNRLLEEWL